LENQNLIWGGVFFSPVFWSPPFDFCLFLWGGGGGSLLSYFYSK